MKKTITLISFILFATQLFAQIESGQVYRIVNAAYNRAVTEDYTTNKITTSATVGTSANEWEQLWMVTNTSGSKYTFQNVFTRHYMSSLVYESKQMTTNTTNSNNEFTIATSAYDNDDYTLQGSTGQYAHCAASQSYHLVGWNRDASYQKAVNAFAMTLVDGVDLEEAYSVYTEINDAKNNTTTIDENLQTLFEDRACTTLRSQYASMEEEELTTVLDGLNLPQQLKMMVLKIRNDSWTENEKRFRIHDYKPYSDADKWASKNLTYAHTNMNNPTGIVSDERGILYIMVNDDIPTDATLYINGVTGESLQNNVTSGTQLQKGLNVVVTSNNGTAMYIYYVVKTIDGKTVTQPLSYYPDMKIHIEGGKVYGYFEEGVDDGELFAWLSTNAQSSEFDAVSMIQVKGAFATWYLHKDDLFAAVTESTILKSIGYWDELVSWEHALSGILHSQADDLYGKIYHGTLLKQVTHDWIDGSNADDYYGSYYNNLAMAYSTTDGYYMYGSWYLSHYQAGGTMRGLINWNSQKNSSSDWGPSHEVGHQHQGPICMPATMECSNNLFSNVNLWMHGIRVTEGCKMEEYMGADYVQGKVFLKQDIWSQMRMYYQLFLYYHVAGHNKQFYPNLFKALRDDPMISYKGQSTATTGKETYFHFVEKCCDIAQEDLTDFFRAWGFFVPFTGDIDDYGIYHMNITQDEIDECIALIKSKGYRKNSSIMFIEDRIDHNDPYTGMAAAGAYEADGIAPDGIKSNNTTYGVVGQFTDFIGDGTVPSEYTITQEGLTITPTGGTGAVGYLIYNENDSLLAYFNTASYTLPDTYDGSTIVIKAIGSSDSTQVIPGFDGHAALTGGLQDAIDSANELLALEDTDGKHPGLYQTTALATLKTLIQEGEQIIDNNLYAQCNAKRDEILAEIESLTSDQTARTPITLGACYRFKNVAYPTRHMFYELNGSEGKVSTTSSDNATYTDQWWVLSEGSVDNTYHIASYNRNYITAVPGSTWASANSQDESDAKDFTTQFRNDGAVYMEILNGWHAGLHCASNNSYRVVGWTSSDPSWWHLEEVQSAEITAQKYTIMDLANEASALVSQVATKKTTLPLQSTSSESAYFISTNADYNTLNNKTDGGGLPALIDGNTNTFFHSDYGGKVSADHYLQIDLGEGNDMSEFIFSYTTRPKDGNNYLNKPTNIIISGSNDGVNFSNVTTLTSTDSNPLPSNTTSQQSFTSDPIESNTPYRYWRFTVTATNSGQKSNGHVFFTMSEFSMQYVTTQYELNPDYGWLDISLIQDLDESATEGIEIAEDVESESAELTTAIDNINNAMDALNEAIENPYVKITITSVGKGTYSSSYNLDFTGRDDIHAYWCDGVSGSYLNINRFENSVPAGEGFYVVGAPGTYNVAIVDDAEEIDGINYFRGNHSGASISVQQNEERDDITYRNFILQNKSTSGLKFYLVNSGGNSVGNNRAYLNLPMNVSDAKEYFDIVIDENVTGISETTDEKQQTEKYNLAGQRVDSNYKGIVITNNKKTQQ